MSSLETITLHTELRGEVKHDGIDRDASHVVIGIGTNEGLLWNTGKLLANDRRKLGIEPLGVINLEVPEEFGERLVSFFREYFAYTSPKDGYNCHRFALWMTGSPDISGKGYLHESPDVLNIMRNGCEAESGLALGQHGVVGDWDWDGFPIAHHSIIGLGPSDIVSQQCIGVNKYKGVLDLRSYVGALKPYQEYENGDKDSKLYAIS